MSLRRFAALTRFAVTASLVLVPAVETSAQLAPADAVQSGFQALQSGDTVKAAAIIGEALARYPADPQLLLGAGVMARVQGRDREAIVLLTRALQVEPRLAAAAAMLGELHYGQGDVDLAIAMYERALAGAPAAAAGVIRQRLDAWKQEAALPQNHEAVKHDRFTISFDGPRQHELAARAVRVLDAAFWRIGKTLGAYPSAPIHVVL